MKLKSYQRFNKGILLMFSHILVASTGYILLISICPMLKPRKMKQYSQHKENVQLAVLYIFANLFKNYFRVQKYGGFLLNYTKILLTVLCWVSRSTVDTEQILKQNLLQSRRKKMKFCTLESRIIGGVGVIRGLDIVIFNNNRGVGWG